MAEPLTTVAELAALLRVSRDTVYDHANATDPALHWENTRIGTRILFTREQVDAAIARSRDTRPDAPVARRGPDREALRVAQGVAGVDRARAPRVKAQAA